jgi:predicted transcriptional regulator
MNLFEIASLKDRVLKYLSENNQPSVSIAIYMELKLENLPYLVFNEYLREMDQEDVLHINEMSGNRHLLFITDKGRRLLFDGGYVKNVVQMTRRQKLHRIVEFLSIESKQQRKSSFDSGELAQAFTPALDIYEINVLCRILMDNNDVGVATTKDESSKGMVAVLVINVTHDAYYTKKYLEEDEDLGIPISHTTISGDNIIFGNISGDVKQEANSLMPEKTEEKMSWLKWLYWIIGILVGITVLYVFIKSIT